MSFDNPRGNEKLEVDFLPGTYREYYKYLVNNSLIRVGKITEKRVGKRIGKRVEKRIETIPRKEW